MTQRFSNTALIHAKNYIDSHTNYTVGSQEYDNWFRQLERAVCYGLVQKYRDLLLTAKPEWNYRNRYLQHNNGESILHMSCYTKNIFLEYLLENGWKDSINIKNKAGNTPFFLFILNRVAEQSNSISDLISIFLKYEADIFAKNNNGQTILDLVKEKAPSSPILNELNDLFRMKQKERALNNYLFYTYFTKQGKNSLLGKLPCCYKFELMNYF